MMNFASFTRFNQQPDLSSFFMSHEVMMDRTGGHQRADWNSICTDLSIGQDDQAEAVLNRVASFFADAINGSSQPGGTFRLWISDVDDLTLPAAMVHSLEVCHLMVRQNRMRHREAMTAFLLSIQQVGFRTDVAFQRHDDFFTDRVDRWIRHLSKQLMEIIVQHARLIAQARKSRIVAH